MRCAGLEELSLRSWLLLPLLFVGSAAGVAGVLYVSVGGGGTAAFRDPVLLSTPLLFGPAAALAILTGGSVRWRSRSQRHGLTLLYSATMLVLALGFGDIRLWLGFALGFGAVALGFLVTLVLRHRSLTRCRAE